MSFKEKLLELILETKNEEFSFSRICKLLNANSKFEKDEINKTLFELYGDGEIYLSEKRTASSLEKAGLKRGILQGNAKGFAFFLPEDKESPDMFIPHGNLNGALHRDTVICRLAKNEESGDVGEVVKIISRGISEIFGSFQKERNAGFVVSEDSKYFTDVFIPQGKTMKAKSGDIVVAKIVAYPEKRKNPEGEVTEILGKTGDKGVDVLSVIKAHGIKTEFEEKTLQEAAKVPQEVDLKNLKGRRDLTCEMVFTIDGKDAKDLDDAITIKKLENGTYKLGVHIADVSSYVKENSAIDKEACERATSVYFIDRVIPMLPESLSNGICSLNEGVLRLTLSCEMIIDNGGNVQSYEVFESYIRSKHRLNYDDVTKLLDGDKEELSKFSDVAGDLFAAKELAEIISKRRATKGSIDFDTKEAKIIVDEKGRAIDVQPRIRNAASKIIEEFMIVANECVAEYANFSELPFIYRVHEKIATEKLDGFIEFVNALGIPFRANYDTIRSKNFADLLSKLDGNVLYLIVNKVLLRSMKKAKYSPTIAIHFGLCSDHYCHFTSPIRRYPDLFIHRMIKKSLHEGFTDKEYDKYFDIADKNAKNSSEKEVVADNAEREVDDMKCAEYLASHVGEEFDGVISGVNSFGVFVELENTCEGLVRTADLPKDSYVYDEKMYKLCGNSHSYKLGDKVKIKVAGSDANGKKTEFVMIV